LVVDTPIRSVPSTAARAAATDRNTLAMIIRGTAFTLSRQHLR
jgi:hypothetical protein